MKNGYAPYNFIRLDDKVIKRYNSENELPSHSKYEENTLHGEIEYEIKCENPLIIAGVSDVKKKNNNGTKEFKKNASGNYIIPGSEIRGLIRSNAAILGLSSMSSDIEDNCFLTRKMAGSSKKLRNEYNKKLGVEQKFKCTALNNVQAGYIKKIKDKEYVIIPAKKIDGKSYFSFKESYKDNRKTEDAKKQLQDLRIPLYGKEQRKYIPNIKENIKYDVVKGTVTSISATKGEYRGSVLSSGFMNKKNKHYIINEKDNNEDVIKIPVKEIEAYEQDLTRSKNNKAYYKLPKKNGEEKPVFYVIIQSPQGEKKLFFGFTLYLRVSYYNSVHKGLPKQHTENSQGFDYNKSLFGTTENISYKSRLSFEDAECTKCSGIENYKLIGGEPKATCLPYYLMQESDNKDQLKSYDDNNFKIRGIKQYWLKDGISKVIIPTNSKMVTEYEAVKENSLFKGRISFSNLSRDELGLILWSLSLYFGDKEKSYQNIGMGKPYGFGRISVNNINLKIDDLKEKYQSFNSDYKHTQDYKTHIQDYKTYLKNKFNINIEEKISVKEFKIMKTNVVKKDAKEFSYTPLEVFKENAVLPDVLEIYKNNFSYQIIQKDNKSGKGNNNNQNNKQQSNNNCKSKNKNNNKIYSENFDNTDNPFAKLKGKF